MKAFDEIVPWKWCRGALSSQSSTGSRRIAAERIRGRANATKSAAADDDYKHTVTRFHKSDYLFFSLFCSLSDICLFDCFKQVSFHSLYLLHSMMDCLHDPIWGYRCRLRVKSSEFCDFVFRGVLIAAFDLLVQNFFVSLGFRGFFYLFCCLFGFLLVVCNG